MNRSRNQWLAIGLLLSLNAAAGAQPQSQATPNNFQHSENQQSSKSQQQDAGKTALVREIQERYENIYQQLAADPQRKHGAWREENLAIVNFANRDVELSLAPADDALRAHLGLPKDQGLIVTALAAHGSAALAGVQPNDVLLKLGEAALAKPDDLEEALKVAGDKPTALAILRAGKHVTVQVQPHVRATMGPVQPAPPAFWIGISVAPVEPALRSQLTLPPNQGLLATQIHEDSAAAKAEVKVHDILISLAGKPLDSQEKLIEVVQANGEKTIPLDVIRKGKPLTIEVTPQRRKQAQLSYWLKTSDLPTLSYQVVRPGFVVSDLNFDVNLVKPFQPQSQGPNSKQSDDTKSTVTRRLDELDVEIKQLHKVIEELSKTLKDKK